MTKEGGPCVYSSTAGDYNSTDIVHHVVLCDT